MQNTAILRNMLEFIGKHQAVPECSADGNTKCYTAFETLSGAIVYLDRVKVETYDGVDTVRSLVHFNSTYSEYKPAPDIFCVAFDSYLQLSVVDALCVHVNALELSRGLKRARECYQKFDVDSWLLGVLLGAHAVSLQCSDWNMHKKTLDVLVRMYRVHKTVFVLDKLYSDYQHRLA